MSLSHANKNAPPFSTVGGTSSFVGPIRIGTAYSQMLFTTGYVGHSCGINNITSSGGGTFSPAAADLFGVIFFTTAGGATTFALPTVASIATLLNTQFNPLLPNVCFKFTVVNGGAGAITITNGGDGTWTLAFASATIAANTSRSFELLINPNGSAGVLCG